MLSWKALALEIQNSQLSLAAVGGSLRQPKSALELGVRCLEQSLEAFH